MMTSARTLQTVAMATVVRSRMIRSRVDRMMSLRFMASSPAAASILPLPSEDQRNTSRRKSTLLLQKQAYDPNTNCYDIRYRDRWLSTVVESPSGSSFSAEGQISPSPSIDVLLREAGIDRENLEKLASQSPTPLKLNDMYNYGTATEPTQRLRNAAFLYKELPIRFAQRAVDLLTLPHGLSEATPIRQVAVIYLKFLRRLQEFPFPETTEQEEAFTDMLQSFVLDRTSIPVSIAQGVNAWWSMKADGNEENASERLQEMDEALYRFFTARVGLRFLTEHYVLSSTRESAKALRNVTFLFPVSDEQQKLLGGIQANLNIAQEIQRVADLVTHQTKEYYSGLCPAIDIVDCAASEHEFTYVPHHLHYMMSELLKNSCRASIRRYKEMLAAASPDERDKIPIPKIRVIIVKGAEDVTIKVADNGGGIPRSLMNKIWKFAHSTASHDESQAEFGTDVSGAKIRGFGLPLARIYARYFGGELTLKSTEGYGLDAYLHLPRLGNSCENLPLRVRDSPGARVSLPVSTRNSSSTSSSTTTTKSSTARNFSTRIERQSKTGTLGQPYNPIIFSNELLAI